MSDRTTAQAVEAYRTMVKCELKAKLAEQELGRILGSPDMDLAEYVRLTTEVDRAVSDFQDKTEGQGYAPSTIATMMSQALNAGRS